MGTGALSPSGIVVVIAVIGSWFVTLLADTTPRGLHDVVARYLRYATRVHGHLPFLADPSIPALMRRSWFRGAAQARG